MVEVSRTSWKDNDVGGWQTRARSLCSRNLARRSRACKIVTGLHQARYAFTADLPKMQCTLFLLWLAFIGVFMISSCIGSKCARDDLRCVVYKTRADLPVMLPSYSSFTCRMMV